ncbi:hypothetical protein [Streptomyces antimicrobicus]|uniref:Uncharacterized protein n=1 Tax=Streptomyces antimicrobicus TaxID=2883108 RepID=A0ABS8B005_9ACTN|nr:hypothetical protein [Streptomyces antimicrobicus]MCB5177939.1 hypothetical protein [Streptomyces antimicrobicus]
MPGESLREFLDTRPAVLDVTDSLHGAAIALTALPATGDMSNSSARCPSAGTSPERPPDPNPRPPTGST